MITSLKPNQVFVFGSNVAGIHGAGAALQARKKFNARLGVGEGPTGQCYAIPTKDKNIRTRSLQEIEVSVRTFLAHANKHRELEFIVSAIGCGLAGYAPHQIAPMFAGHPDNVIIPECFASI